MYVQTGMSFIVWVEADTSFIMVWNLSKETENYTRQGWSEFLKQDQRYFNPSDETDAIFNGYQKHVSLLCAKLLRLFLEGTNLWI